MLRECTVVLVLARSLLDPLATAIAPLTADMAYDDREGRRQYATESCGGVGCKVTRKSALSAATEKETEGPDGRWERKMRWWVEFVSVMIPLHGDVESPMCSACR